MKKVTKQLRFKNDTSVVNTAKAERWFFTLVKKLLLIKANKDICMCWSQRAAHCDSVNLFVHEVVIIII